MAENSTSFFEFREGANFYGYQVRWKGLLIGQVWSDNDPEEGREPASYWEADETEESFSTKQEAANFLLENYRAFGSVA